MSSINFDNIYLLYIVIPLAVLFTVPFAIAIRKDNVNGHNIASYALHILLAAIVAFAAAGTSVRTYLTETNVYVVADVSYSANKNLGLIDRYIDELEFPQNCKVGLVCFGKDCELVYNMGDPAHIPSVRNSHVDTSETNIAAALDFTGELFKDDVIKRLVLITDGRQTDESDDYAVTRAVQGLEAQNVRVDAIYLNDNITSAAREVQLSSVEYTKNTYIDRAETAQVLVQSTRPAQAIITLKRDGETERQRSVSLEAGSNQFGFDLYTAAEGEYDYEVTVNTISASDDENAYNNTYYFTQNVTGDMKVLYVTESWSDATAAAERYAGHAAVDIYERDQSVSAPTYPEKQRFVMSQYGNQDDIKFNLNSLNVPINIEQLCAYDEIVLANVNLVRVTGYDEFIENLDIAVRLFGKSLLTIGDLSIQSDDGEEQPELAALGNMLPVNFGNDTGDQKSYTIVLDGSRSMFYLHHLDVAKELSCRLLDILNNGDLVTVVGFYGNAYFIQEPVVLTSSNRQTIKQSIMAVDELQGTVIGAGLRMAYQFSSDSYADNQVMLISDGLDFGAEDPVEIAAEMYESGIVTSVFDVGRQGDNPAGGNVNEQSAAGKKRLEDIASEGHGGYYYSNNLESVNDVTFGQVADKVKISVVEKDSAVGVSRRNDPLLENIDCNNIPNISGYMYTGAKRSAVTVLNAEYSRTKRVPLYSYWQYGNGKVSTFTSRMGGGWLDGWQTDGFDEMFLDNVFRESMPVERNVVPYNTEIRQEGTNCRVEITPSNYRYDAVATVTVTTPDGDRFTERMSEGSNYYFCDFTVDSTGKYSLDIIYTYDGEDYNAVTSFNYSYTDEYDSFAVFDPSVLVRALNGKGVVQGINEDQRISLENDDKDVDIYDLDLTVILLIVAVVLYVADIIIRKLKWEDIRSFFGFGKSTKKKDRKKGGKNI